MAKTLSLFVRLDVGGRPLSFGRYTSTITVPEAFNWQHDQRSEADKFRSLPIEQLAEVHVFALRCSNQGVKLHLGEQNTAGVPLQKRGFFLLWNGHLCARPNTNATVENDNEREKLARLEGIAGGE
jgi:hypothetical protein